MPDMFAFSFTVESVITERINTFSITNTTEFAGIKNILLF